MTDSTTYLQAETTAASRDDAERLACEMVERRLAACAQITGPIRSVYRWDDKMHSDEEFRVTFKTRSALVARFKEELAGFHPYDVPEILFFKIEDGAGPYLDWVGTETQPANDR